MKSVVIFILFVSSFTLVASKGYTERKSKPALKRRVLIKDESLQSDSSDDVLDSMEREALQRYFKKTGKSPRNEFMREGQRRGMLDAAGKGNIKASGGVNAKAGVGAGVSGDIAAAGKVKAEVDGEVGVDASAGAGVAAAVAGGLQWKFIKDDASCTGLPACPQPAAGVPSPFNCAGGVEASAKVSGSVSAKSSKGSRRSTFGEAETKRPSKKKTRGHSKKNKRYKSIS